MKTKTNTLLFLALASTGAMAGEAPPPPPADPAAAPISLWDAVRPIVDLRARYELREQDGLSDSHAATLRGRLGLHLDDWNGLSALAEYEGTLPADRDSYQAASVHGLGLNRAIIADPESHELNRLWVGYDAFDTKIKVGRQRINLGNQRFVGTVGWRQNEQTYDAVTLSNSSIENLALNYSYVNRVNRIFGSGAINTPAQHDFEGDSHLVDISYTGVPDTTLNAYAYWMDLGNTAGDAASNRTFGASIEHRLALTDSLTAPLRGEFAYQENAFDSPLNYNSTYYHLTAGVESEGNGISVGYESLGEDFRTPLATLHKFNGYADKFLGTPADGLSDLYVAGSVKLPAGFVFKPAFHWFGPRDGGFGYGTEVDAVVAKKLTDNATLLAKYARYFADEFGEDTTDFTLQLGYTY